MASVVFPTPPGPTSVTRRSEPTMSMMSASSASRPMRPERVCVPTGGGGARLAGAARSRPTRPSSNTRRSGRVKVRNVRSPSSTAYRLRQPVPRVADLGRRKRHRTLDRRSPPTSDEPPVHRRTEVVAVAFLTSPVCTPIRTRSVTPRATASVSPVRAAPTPRRRRRSQRWRTRPPSVTTRREHMTISARDRLATTSS